MALHWDISPIQNKDTVCYEPTENGRVMTQQTNDLIYLTVAVDIGTITAENADEFYIRASLIRDLYGSASRTGIPELPIEVIRQHIGLSTNVLTLNRKEWLKGVVKNKIAGRLREYQYRLDHLNALATERNATTVGGGA